MEFQGLWMNECLCRFLSITNVFVFCPLLDVYCLVWIYPLLRYPPTGFTYFCSTTIPRMAADEAWWKTNLNEQLCLIMLLMVIGNFCVFWISSYKFEKHVMLKCFNCLLLRMFACVFNRGLSSKIAFLQLWACVLRWLTYLLELDEFITMMVAPYVLSPATWQNSKCARLSIDLYW